MRKIKFLVSVLLFTCIIVFGTVATFLEAFCQEFREKSGEWIIFTNEKEDRIVCYVASVPIKTDSKISNKGEPFFLVTNIENDADEISVSMGFLFNNVSEVELTVSEKKFYLFPYKSLAWANSKNDDIEIIKEMQKANEMTIYGTSKDGKNETNTYSLLGFPNAYKKLKDICREIR